MIINESYEIKLPADPEQEDLGLAKIDEETFLNYMKFENDKKILNRRIIEPFKNSLCASTGYDDENLPESPQDLVVPVGSVEYRIHVTPTTKRPSYKNTLENFENFINFLIEQNKNGVRREGVRIFEGKEGREPYVRNDILLEKLVEGLTKLTEGKEGVRFKIECMDPALKIEVPEKIYIVWNRNYGALTDYNARIFQQARNFLVEGKKRTEGYTTKKNGKTIRVKRFKEILLEEGLTTLGIKAEELEEPVAIQYPFEHIVFIQQLEPRKSVKYKNVVEALIKDAPQKITKRSRIGDLVLIENFDNFKESGFVNEKFIEDYDPRRYEGSMYIRLFGIKKRVEQYIKEFEESNIEQNIFIAYFKFY